MNKIIIFITTVFFGSYQLIGQSSILLTQHTPSTATTPATTITIANGSVIHRTVEANNCDAPNCMGVGINVKNISSSTKTYKMKKFIDIINTVTPISDLAIAYFCFGGQCESPFALISSNELILNSNEDADGLKKPTAIYYDEATKAGYSSVRYQVFDVNNPSDNIEFTLKYNDPTSSIKTNPSLTYQVSDVLPNPSSSKTAINIDVLNNINNVTIFITNIFGKIESLKTTNLLIGKNEINLDSDNLSDGLYFITLNINNSKITKRLTICK